jgi:hypothetical protein
MEVPVLMQSKTKRRRHLLEEEEEVEEEERGKLQRRTLFHR